MIEHMQLGGVIAILRLPTNCRSTDLFLRQ